MGLLTKHFLTVIFSDILGPRRNKEEHAWEMCLLETILDMISARLTPSNSMTFNTKDGASGCQDSERLGRRGQGAQTGQGGGGRLEALCIKNLGITWRTIYKITCVNLEECLSEQVRGALIKGLKPRGIVA